AAAEAKAQFIDASATVIPYWPNSHWGMSSYVAIGARTGFSFQTENGLDVDCRGALFYLACAPPKNLGAATMYLNAPRDASNALLDGGKSYRLRVPPNVPAKQFWAVTVYDFDTAAFIRD